MTRPLLSLCMVVRDEGETIAETIASAREACDRFTILVDKATTDDTREKVLEATKGMPGSVVVEPFEDFATTRNRVLDLEASAEDPAIFTLMLSGDEYLRNGKALREFLEQRQGEDAFCVRIRLDESEWDYPRVLRVGSPWRYEGKVHEAPVDRVNQRDTGPTVPGVHIDHEVRDPDKRLMSVLERHIPLLRETLAENPLDARAVRFLAHSLEDVAKLFDDATALSMRAEALGCYLRRLAIEGGDAEKARVKLRYLATAEDIGVYTPVEALARADALCAEAPGMPEAHYLRAYFICKSRPVLEVLAAAERAADAARDASPGPIAYPRDMSCEWRACLMAARAAKRAARHDPKYLPVAAAWAERGKTAGGPSWMFLAAMSDPPSEGT